MKEMVLAEKQQLSAAINALDDESLIGVVDILMRNMPELQKNAGSEIQLDLDKIQSTVLWELDGYVKSKSKKRKAEEDVTPRKDVLTASNASLTASTGVKKSNKKAEIASRNLLVREQIVTGAEKILRKAKKPMTGLELLRAGLEQGYFVPLNISPQSLVVTSLNTAVKTGKKCAISKEGNKFGLREWTMPEGEEKAKLIADRESALNALPAPVPSSKDTVDLCYLRLIIGELFKKKEWVWIFDKPVDPIALNVPDYLIVIKEPMDLGTIRDRLLNDEYTTSAEVVRHIRLVFANAMTYNAPGSQVFMFAQGYSDLFETLYKLYIPDAKDHREPSMPTTLTVVDGEGGEDE